eukprot:Clim_evm6s56 gene=Clim_evmTU6s56
MTVVKVNIKWAKQKFEGIELNTESEPLEFKYQLYSLTGVPPERQKIMVKGGILKDDGDWSKIGPKEGQTFMMMGTAGEVMTEVPTGTARPKFDEDLAENQADAMMRDTPAGMVNLGNTCYMNSTVQVLHNVPELRDILKQTDARIPSSTPAGKAMTDGLADVFRQLDGKADVQPIMFWTILKQAVPQFAETQQGMPMQQDAQECWSAFLTFMNQTVRAEKGASDSFIQRNFEGNMKQVLKCVESEGEEQTSVEKFSMLPCHISKEISFMQGGLKERMTEHITKRSEKLDRDAEWEKTSEITRLPKFLTVNFVRFAWKSGANVRAKVLKNVKFPLSYDAHELCSPELKEQLKAGRDFIEKANGPKDDKDDAMDLVLPENTDPGSNQSGMYDLIGVVTHQGRTADSGHYVAWCKQGPNKWAKFDDDKVSFVNDEEILKLSGGGDWHTAYILLYAEKDLALIGKEDEKKK